ncbi:MAG: hypothetical protein AB7O24_09250 [Kofleriaceae bacterium]
MSQTLATLFLSVGLLGACGSEGSDDHSMPDATMMRDAPATSTQTACFPPRPRAATTTCETFASTGDACITLLALPTTICTVSCSPDDPQGCPDGFICDQLDPQTMPDVAHCRRPCITLADCDPGYAECDTAGTTQKVCK